MDQQTPREEPRPAETGTTPGKRRFWGGVGTGLGVGAGIAIGVVAVLLIIAIVCFAMMGRGCSMMDRNMMGRTSMTAPADAGAAVSPIAMAQDRAVRSWRA